MAEDWSQSEVEIVVADYFDMLREELLGREVNKTEHRRRIEPLLSNRTHGSIEYKHQNISAVLIDARQPYIDGYKPAGNYQRLLAEVVEGYLHDHQGFFGQLAEAAPRLNPVQVPTLLSNAWNSIIVAPPEVMGEPTEPPRPWVPKRGRHVDFVRRDAENHRLGKLGEQFIVELERHRLRGHRRDDLARRVCWASQESGDGLGYDVLSFDENSDTERYIEVKTTGLGKYFPFYVSQNEVRCSQALTDQYRLYRVFDFATDARVYVLNGDLTRACRLDPVQYRATL